MKIAIFSDVFLEVSGGIPSSLVAQKASLEKLGHEVTVFCPGRQSLDSTIVIVPTCKALRPGNAPLARNPQVIERWVVRNFPMFAQFDVVHVHYEAGCSIAGARLARRFKIPLIQTMHGREDMALAMNIPYGMKTLVGTSLNWFHTWSIPRETVVRRDKDYAKTVGRAQIWSLMVNQANFADYVVTPSQHFAKKLQKYGVKKPIKVISNGVEDDLAKGDWPVRRLQRGEPLKLMWNSRVSNEKRILPFLQAVARVNYPIEFYVFGKGNALKRARKFVRERGLEQRVHFNTKVEHAQILEKMRDKHLGVMASYGFDTQGLTLLEAEATGMPVFYCDPDMAEIVPKGGGIEAEGPSVGQMAAALETIIENPEKIEEMSKVMLARRREVLQSVQIEKLIDLYKLAILQKK